MQYCVLLGEHSDISNNPFALELNARGTLKVNII
jgi:hypothetical protein